MSESKSIVVKIAQNGMLGAFYFILTIVCSSFSFGAIQFRISEFLILLCFFRPDFIIGITIGTLLSNLTSPIPFDFLLGTLGTMLSAFLVAYASPRLFVSMLYPILVNTFVVGTEVFFLANTSSMPYMLCCGYVALGETVVIVAGYLIFVLLMKNKGFRDALSPTRHKEIKY